MTVKILGYTFREMDHFEKDGFAGVEPGTLICTIDDLTLFWDPTNKILSEMTMPDDEGKFEQRDWTFQTIV